MPSKHIQKDASQIGQLLRQARETAGLTQADAAKRVGMDPGNLSRLENGKHRATRATIIALANVYGRPVSYFGLADDATVPRGTMPRHDNITRQPSDPVRALRLIQNDIERQLIERGASEETLKVAGTLFAGLVSGLRGLIEGESEAVLSRLGCDEERPASDIITENERPSRQRRGGRQVG